MKNGRPLLAAHEGPGLIGHALVDVSVRLVGDRRIVDELPRREIPAAAARAGCPGRMRPVDVKPLVAWLVGVARLEVVPEVPFAEVGGGVAGIPQPLGECVVVGTQSRERVRDEHSCIPRRETFDELHLLDVACRRGDARACRVLSGHDARPRRRAERAGGEGVGEPDPAGGEAVDVRRLVERAAKTAEIANAEVIREDQHDVGPVGGGGHCRSEDDHEAQGESREAHGNSSKGVRTHDGSERRRRVTPHLRHPIDAAACESSRES